MRAKTIRRRQGRGVGKGKTRQETAKWPRELNNSLEARAVVRRLMVELIIK